MWLKDWSGWVLAHVASWSSTNTMTNEDDGAAVPQAQKAGWGAFLKQIASFSGDLSSLTAPPFILSPVSLAEFPSYWGEPAAAFAAIATGATPEERQILVTKWYLATLAGQFTRREKETGSEKKPLNPILGEQFLGHYTNGDLSLRAEQVSHHPPITAYVLENNKAGITYEGNCAQKTSFSGRTISVKQVGHGLLRLTLANGQEETYLITLPKLKIEGIFLGKPYVELADSSYIQSSTGLTSSITYVGAGWVSGKAHTFKLAIGTGPDPKNPLYEIDGQWTGTSTFSKKSARAGEVFFDTVAEPTAPIVVAPVEAQGEYESRRVWKATADGIRRGDFDAASVAKTALENAERQKRKDEKEGRAPPFATRLCVAVPNDPQYRALAAMCKHKPEEETSWAFNRV